mmetsp:Transcript_7251/g.12647  ORF Transcript_7251/g.12647 Transcript_7251/m.12647 type:complete len:417 (+) Transcript_7251:90-1340(+)
MGASKVRDGKDGRVTGNAPKIEGKRGVARNGTGAYANLIRRKTHRDSEGYDSESTLILLDSDTEEDAARKDSSRAKPMLGKFRPPSLKLLGNMGTRTRQPSLQKNSTTATDEETQSDHQAPEGAADATRPKSQSGSFRSALNGFSARARSVSLQKLSGSKRGSKAKHDGDENARERSSMMGSVRLTATDWRKKINSARFTIASGTWPSVNGKTTELEKQAEREAPAAPPFSAKARQAYVEWQASHGKDENGRPLSAESFSDVDASAGSGREGESGRNPSGSFQGRSFRSRTLSRGSLSSHTLSTSSGFEKKLSSFASASSKVAHRISSMVKQRGEYEQAMDNYKALLAKNNNKHNADTGTALFNIALGLATIKGEREEALVNAERAEQVFIECVGEDDDRTKNAQRLIKALRARAR